MNFRVYHSNNLICVKSKNKLIRIYQTWIQINIIIILKCKNFVQILIIGKKKNLYYLKFYKLKKY